MFIMGCFCKGKVTVFELQSKINCGMDMVNICHLNRQFLPSETLEMRLMYNTIILPGLQFFGMNFYTYINFKSMK